MKLTPTEKLHKLQRDNLKSQQNRISSAFSLKKLRTWEDIYRAEGIPAERIEKEFTHEQRTKTVIFSELKTYFATQQKQLEEKQKEVKQEASIVVVKEIPQAPQRSNEVVQKAVERLQETTAPTNSKEPTEVKHTAEDNYGYVRSPKTTAKLFWFQMKAVTDMLKDIYV